MRILLIMPPERGLSSTYRVPPYGLMVLASICKLTGHDVEIKDYFSWGYSQSDLIETLQCFQPDVVGLSGMFFHQTPMVHIAKEVKQYNNNIKIVAGGVHATTCPESLLQYGVFDLVFRGEAEETLPLYLEALEQKKDIPRVDGLCFVDDKAHTHIGPPAQIADLDSLPFPAWDLCTPEVYNDGIPHGFFYHKRPVATIVTSRGCPNKCSFCAGHAVLGRRWRAVSPQRVLKEIRYLVNNFGVREIHIQDDNFSLSKRRALEICDLIIADKLGIAISCPNGLHLKTLDRELLAKMREAGFYNMAVGIESGSEAIQKRMCKNLNLNMVREKVKLIREFGFDVTGFFMIGMPYETEEDIQRTISFAVSLPLSGATCSMFMPLPGTKEYNDLISKGAIDESTIDPDSRGWLEGNPHQCYEHVTPERLKQLQKQFAFRFWARPKVCLRALCRIFLFMSWKDFFRAGLYFLKYTTRLSHKNKSFE